MQANGIAVVGAPQLNQHQVQTGTARKVGFWFHPRSRTVNRFVRARFQPCRPRHNKALSFRGRDQANSDLYFRGTSLLLDQTLPFLLPRRFPLKSPHPARISKLHSPTTLRLRRLHARPQNLRPNPQPTQKKLLRILHPAAFASGRIPPRRFHLQTQHQRSATLRARFLLQQKKNCRGVLHHAPETKPGIQRHAPHRRPRQIAQIQRHQSKSSAMQQQIRPAQRLLDISAAHQQQSFQHHSAGLRPARIESVPPIHHRAGFPPLRQSSQQRKQKTHSPRSRRPGNFRQTTARQSAGKPVNLRNPASRHFRQRPPAHRKRRRNLPTQGVFQPGTKRSQSHKGRRNTVSLFLRLFRFSLQPPNMSRRRNESPTGHQVHIRQATRSAGVSPASGEQPTSATSSLNRRTYKPAQKRKQAPPHIWHNHRPACLLAWLMRRVGPGFHLNTLNPSVLLRLQY